MSYAIVGFGKIGHALAKAFARKGIEVSVATTRDPKSFAADAAAIGPTIIPKTLGQAVKADIVFLAVRFEAHPDVAKALHTWQGKTIIDVTNAYVIDVNYFCRLTTSILAGPECGRGCDDPAAG
jgi:hypothetical protein